MLPARDDVADQRAADMHNIPENAPFPHMTCSSDSRFRVADASRLPPREVWRQVTAIASESTTIRQPRAAMLTAARVVNNLFLCGQHHHDTHTCQIDMTPRSSGRGRDSELNYDLPHEQPHAIPVQKRTVCRWGEVDGQSLVRGGLRLHASARAGGGTQKTGLTALMTKGAMLSTSAIPPSTLFLSESA